MQLCHVLTASALEVFLVSTSKRKVRPLGGAVFIFIFGSAARWRYFLKVPTLCGRWRHVVLAMAACFDCVSRGGDY